MRVLFFGDLAATGFGTVTSDLGRAMIDLGLDVRFVSQNEFDSLPEPFFSRTIDLLTFIHSQASATDPHGGVMGIPDFVPAILKGEAGGLSLVNREPWGEWKPEAVLFLGDFYGFRLVVQRLLPEFTEVPAFHYVPIEGEDLPPRWADLWRVIQPVAMSRFGQDQIERVTGTRPPLAYHGVNPGIFRPVSPSEPIVLRTERDGKEIAIALSSRERCRAFFGVHPAAKVILRTDRNMPRKGYPAMLRALDPVMKARPDVVLMIHARSFDQGGYLWDSVSKMDPSVQPRVLIPDLPSMPRDVLVALYNCADVYVSTSAEGFGLTIAEAISCGVPAVGLDYSAVPEVIGPAGKVIPVGMRYDNEYAHEWAGPDEGALGAAVAFLLDHPAKARALGAEGPRHVRETFSWQSAAEVFADLFRARLRA